MPGLFIIVFLAIFAAVLIASAIGFATIEAQRKRQVASVLKTVTGINPDAPRPIVLIQPEKDSDFTERLLRRLNLAGKLETDIAQAGLDWSLTTLLSASGIGAIAGLLIGWKIPILVFSTLTALTLGIAFAFAPYLYVRHKRKQRFAEFEEQFPEALDFLARSMRAGHAFSVSLEMLGEESPDPLGREFRALFNEQNLGANIEVALGNLGRRVPITDVHFFISAVMLQRQTGGNLGEILSRLSYVIRERFRLRGQVKAASAHGRITAGILTAMPILLTGALTLIAPTYLKILTEDPDGKYLIVAAIFSQLLGYYFIRRIVNIKV